MLRLADRILYSKTESRIYLLTAFAYRAITFIIIISTSRFLPLPLCATAYENRHSICSSYAFSCGAVILDDDYRHTLLNRVVMRVPSTTKTLPLVLVGYDYEYVARINDVSVTSEVG